MLWEIELLTLWSMHTGSLLDWLTFIVLFLTFVCVAWYLYETRRIRIASDQQLEAQIRPAIAVRQHGAPTGLVLHNVGKGPAFGVILSAAERGSSGKHDLDRLVNQDIAYLEERRETPTGVYTQPCGVGGVPILNGSSFQCQYTSLSGRTYWTVVDFDKPSGNTVIETRFYTERDGAVIRS